MKDAKKAAEDASAKLASDLARLQEILNKTTWYKCGSHLEAIPVTVKDMQDTLDRVEVELLRCKTENHRLKKRNADLEDLSRAQSFAWLGK
jgi:hypothetical protein